MNRFRLVKLGSDAETLPICARMFGLRRRSTCENCSETFGNISDYVTRNGALGCPVSPLESELTLAFVTFANLWGYRLEIQPGAMLRFPTFQ